MARRGSRKPSYRTKGRKGGRGLKLVGNVTHSSTSRRGGRGKF